MRRFRGGRLPSSETQRKLFMQIRRLTITVLGLALVVAPAMTMAMRANHTNNGKAPAGIHGIGPGGVPALRDRLLRLIHALELRLESAEDRLAAHDAAIGDLQGDVADLDSRLEELEGQFSDDDGDTFTEVQDDCDDDNADINPLADEVAGNGIDDDCDHEVDEAA